MSVPDQVPKTELIVSGANVTQFDYDFYAPNTANVYVLVNSSAVSSGWTISGNEGGSGFVKFDSPVISGATVTMNIKKVSFGVPDAALVFDVANYPGAVVVR